MPVTISGTDNFVLNADSLGTAVAGALDYDGTALYFTPAGTQRGVLPGAQFFRLNAGLAGANVNTAQNVFGVGVTLSASTVYAFEAVYAFSKSAGTTSHTFTASFGGVATINNISYVQSASGNTTSFATQGTPNVNLLQSTSGGVFGLATASATVFYVANLRGTISVNAGGTFIPQYTLSAAPGGAYTTAAGSYFLIYPIGASGANVNVGTWA